MKKINNLKSIFKTFILSGMFLLTGCQNFPNCHNVPDCATNECLPPCRETTIQKMQGILEESACQDRAFARKDSSALPIEIRQALLPNAVTSKTTPGLQKRFDLYANHTPAKTFFLSLAEGTPYNITVHPAVEGNISLELKKVTIQEVLQVVRNIYGFDYRLSNRTIEILPATIQTRAFQVTYLDINRGGESETRVLAGGLNTSSNNGVQSPVGATSTNSGSSTQPIVNSHILTKTRADFWEELRKTVEGIVGLNEGRKVAVSPMAGLIVVQAMPNELNKVAEFLKNAQLTMNRQVILDAKILEVELNESFQAGINWALLSGRLSATQLGGDVVATPFNPNQPFPILTAEGAPSPINISPGQALVSSGSNAGAFGGVFALAMNYKNLGAFVELLGAQGNVKVLSSPRIATTNNQKALIKVGQDNFFVTNVSTTTVATTAGTQSLTPSVTFDSFFSGIALDVTPSISGKEEVILHIHPTVSLVTDQNKTVTLNGEAQTFPLAASTVRESDSIVRAKSGQMVIIGGLMQEQTGKVSEGIPGLKRLPVVGKIFQHQVKKNKKSELVILLRPIVADDDTWVKSLDEEAERFRKLEIEECLQS